MDLEDGERRAAVGHHVLDACLMHGDDIGVALDHEYAVFLHNGLLRLEDAVELALLVIDVAVGRVDVLLCHALGSTVKDTTSKGHHLAANVQPGEDGAAAVAVH